MKTIQKLGLTAAVFLTFASQAFAADMASARDILWQGLLGAGVGAVSAEVSGGKAGKGALIGAGTNVIGGALLNVFTQPSGYSQPSYVQSYTSAPVQVQQPVVYQPPVYRQPEPVYAQSAPVYYTQAPAEDTNRKIIKQGLMGAGVGAISSYASGGKGGQGALIGAGTNVIGGALFDVLSAPAAQPSAYSYPYAPSAGYSQVPPQTGTKHVLRKFDSNGKIVSEEEFWA